MEASGPSHPTFDIHPAENTRENEGPSALALPKRRLKHREQCRKPDISESLKQGDSGVATIVPSEDASAPARKRKKNLGPDVKTALATSAMSDQNALLEADAIWNMFQNPAYGDPAEPEDDFSDLAIRFAQRGLRWAKLALAHGVTMTNRRILSESRSFHGYGINKPGAAPQLSPDHTEYDTARAEYIRNLLQIAHEVEDANHVRRLRD